MTYDVFTNGYGHSVIRIADGHATLIASTGADLALAERIRDLLDRHGLIDVPLDQVQP